MFIRFLFRINLFIIHTRRDPHIEAMMQQLSKPDKQALNQLKYREKIKVEKLRHLLELEKQNIEEQTGHVQELEKKIQRCHDIIARQQE